MVLDVGDTQPGHRVRANVISVTFLHRSQPKLGVDTWALTIRALSDISLFFCPFEDLREVAQK
jgi:hypothetical protein